MSPRKDLLTIEMSPSPRPESSGNESAEQQLFIESQSSASKPRQPPSHSAIRSAHLLNAARVDKLRVASDPPSSALSRISQTPGLAENSANMATGKDSAGKLKRPSFLREDMARNPRRNLARRGDVFDLDVESPEKKGGALYKLSETVNRSKPLKRAKKGKKADVQSNQLDAAALLSSPPSGQPVQAMGEDQPPIGQAEALRLSSQSPTIYSHTVHGAEEDNRKSGRLAGGNADIIRIDFAKKPGALPPRQTQTKRKAGDQAAALERSSKSLRRENPEVLEQPKTKAAINVKSNVRTWSRWSHPIVIIPASKPNATTRARTKAKALPLSEDGQTQDQLQGNLGPNTHSTAGHQDEPPLADAEPRPTRRGRGRPARASNNLPSRSILATKPEASSVLTRPKGRPKRPKTKNTEPTTSIRPRPRRAIETSADEEIPPDMDWDGGQQATGGDDDEAGTQDVLQDAGAEAEQSDTDESEAEGTDPDREQTVLEQVFAFTRLEKRRGKCRTDEATHIKRTCRAGLLSLKQPGTTVRDVSTSIQEIRALLSEFGVGDGAEELTQLKVDAYGYLFRELVTYLVVLYPWLEQTYGDVTESLRAMRVVVDFAQAIVSFRDAITSWKVQLPTRYKNDRLVKDVDMQLISPLRRVVGSYRVALDQLEGTANALRVHDELRQKRRERTEEQRRKELNDSLQKERWKRWQDLHVWRQQCEPDHLRRRYLYIDPNLFAARFENYDERDANGIKFERIPLFKERDSPPRRASSAEEDWTDEQMAALIEGLTDFAGPDVFRRIFKRYCRPGSALRDFTVPDLTAQAASIRSTLLAQYEGKNWEVPDWIKQIPILP